MEEDLIALLLADAGTAALVGNRITWSTRPQASQLPALVLSKVSAARDYHLQGPSGLNESRVQVDAWGSSFGTVIRAARAVEAALSGLRATHRSTIFQGAFLESERQSFEEASGGAQVHRISMDFILHHRKVG